MKKYFISLGLMIASVFTLTNCTVEIENVVDPSIEGVPFEIVASSAVTKTTNDGLSTVWAEGDALNIFHALSSSTEYKNDGEFVFTGENIFKGKLTEALVDGEPYNLYALYPYNKNVETPGTKTTRGYTTVGSTSSLPQIQTGNNSMAHIAGENYPLAGVCANWTGGSSTPVEIEMSHLSSLLEVVVKNETGKALTVESVSFTAMEDIVGTFYIDITGDAPVFTASGNNYVAKSAKLEVEEGEAIANGETAKFYLAIKPFIATGDITLAVNNIAKTASVTELAFNAGAIKTFNYTMKATDVLEKSNIEDAIDVADNTIVQIEGQVVAKYNKGFLVQDETGIMLIYQNATPEVVVGDIVNVTGTKTVYNGFAQLKIPTIKVLSTGNIVNYPTPTVLDGAALDEQLSAKSVSYIQYTGKLSAGSYYNITVDGATTAIGSVVYPDSSLGLAAMNGETIVVTGYFIYASSSKYVNTVAVSVEVIPTVATPVIVCSEDGNVEITCETEGAKIYYTTDGTQPSATNGTLYSGAFDVESGITVKAIAVKEGCIDSQVDTETYVYQDPNAGGGESEDLVTYKHVFTSKPLTGSVTLSEVKWTLAATNLNNYNSQNYAGVQFGTSSKNGQFKLTSADPFTFSDKSNVKEIRLWLNTGGGTVTPTVTVGGQKCTQNGTITKNSSAGNDYTKASLVTFTPPADASGVVVIDVTSSGGKAGYFCAFEIDVY